MPCFDITLKKEVFESKNVLGVDPLKANTSPFTSFGKVAESPKVSGNVRCSGSILRSNLDGSDLLVYAWGFRNPYGLEFVDDQLYVTEQGFEERGSRLVKNSKDCLYKISVTDALKESSWYGWPDHK